MPTHDTFFRLRRVCLASLALLFVVLWGVPAQAQFGQRPDDPAANPDEWLLDARWGEVRYGLTVREPANSLRSEQTRDGGLARWSMPGEYNISLDIQQGMSSYGQFVDKIERADGSTAEAGGGSAGVFQEPLRLNNLIADLAASIEAAGAKNVVNAELHHWVEVGEYIGYINYFAVFPRGENAEPWLYGIGLVQLDDFNVVILRLECSQESAELGTSTFESMLHSIEVESAEAVIERLRGWMNAGRGVLDGITEHDRQRVMHPDRLFRIRELVPSRDGRRLDEVDIGYMRIWQRHQDADYYQTLLAQVRAERDDPEARLEGVDGFTTPGNALVIQSYYRAQGSQISQMREYLDADDDADIDEVWNFKTELRQPGQQRYGRHEGLWVETGVRDDLRPSPGSSPVNRIQVVREGTPPRQITDYVLARERQNPLLAPSARPEALPAGDVSNHQWQTPERGYMSQVDAMIVPALLPADEEKTYGFFVYHPDSSSLAIRVMRVVPQPGGGKIVFIRPTIDLAEEAMEFDRNGNLVRWLFPDGRSMVQTTRDELARIWNVRLPRD